MEDNLQSPDPGNIENSANATDRRRERRERRKKATEADASKRTLLSQTGETQLQLRSIQSDNVEEYIDPAPKEDEDNLNELMEFYGQAKNTENNVDNSGTFLTETGKAFFINQQESIKQEKEMLVRVSPTPPNIQTQDSSFSPRNLGDEGLFVNKKPSVVSAAQYRVEQRLLHEFGAKAFGADGKMNNQPNPLKYIHERPSEFADQTQKSMLSTSFMEPTLVVPVNEVSVGKKFEMVLELREILFHFHSFFSEEEYLASELEILHKQYKERQTLNVVQLYSDKLAFLKEQLQMLKQNPARSAISPTAVKRSQTLSMKTLSGPSAKMELEALNYADKLKRTQEQIRRVRNWRDSEEHTDLTLVRKMVLIWNKLKKLREDQGYITTSVKLLIKKKKQNAEQDLEALQQQMAEELEEMREEHHATYATQLKEHQFRVQSQRTLDLEQMPAFKDFDEAIALQSLTQKYKSTKRKPGTPILIPKLEYSVEDITLEERLPPEEKSRLQILSKMRFST
jgi:hypothetical protein